MIVNIYLIITYNNEHFTNALRIVFSYFFQALALNKVTKPHGLKYYFVVCLSELKVPFICQHSLLINKAQIKSSPHKKLVFQKNQKVC